MTTALQSVPNPDGQPKEKRVRGPRKPAPTFPAIEEQKQRLAAMQAIGRAIDSLPNEMALEVLRAAMDHVSQKPQP